MRACLSGLIQDFTAPMNQHVLLVAEDDAMDALLLDRAIRKAGLSFRMVRVENGEQLIAYLRGDGVYCDRGAHPLPEILLLDLKMPRADGFAVLKWRQQHTTGYRLPVVVFSSSSLQQDIEKAYSLGANSYVVKPTAPDRLEHMVTALHKWWTDFNVTLPVPAI